LLFIDRRPKGRPRKNGKLSYKENGICCTILIKKNGGKRKSNIARPDPIKYSNKVESQF